MKQTEEILSSPDTVTVVFLEEYNRYKRLLDVSQDENLPGSQLQSLTLKQSYVILAHKHRQKGALCWTSIASGWQETFLRTLAHKPNTTCITRHKKG